MKNEQRKDIQKGRHPLPFYARLAYLVVCTFLLTGVSFSKYVTRSSAADSARVAKGIVKVEGVSNPALEVREKTSSGGIGLGTYEFNVSNENSEVAIGYDIVVTLDKPLPEGVTMALSNDNGDPMYTSDISPDRKVYTYSNAGTFEAGEAGKEKPNEHTLSFLVFFISLPGVGTHNYGIDISINSYQID